MVTFQWRTAGFGVGVQSWKRLSQQVTFVVDFSHGYRKYPPWNDGVFYSYNVPPFTLWARKVRFQEVFDAGVQEACLAVLGKFGYLKNWMRMKVIPQNLDNCNALRTNYVDESWLSIMSNLSTKSVSC